MADAREHETQVLPRRPKAAREGGLSCVGRYFRPVRYLSALPGRGSGVATTVTTGCGRFVVVHVPALNRSRNRDRNHRFFRLPLAGERGRVCPSRAIERALCVARALVKKSGNAHRKVLSVTT